MSARPYGCVAAFLAVVATALSAAAQAPAGAAAPCNGRPGRDRGHRSRPRVHRSRRGGAGCRPSRACRASCRRSAFTRGRTKAGDVLFRIEPEQYEAALAKESAAGILARVRGALVAIPSATVLAFNPPSIPGIGATGGFDLRLQARSGQSPQDLAAAMRALVLKAKQDPALASVFSTFSAGVPQIFLDVGRVKAEFLPFSARRSPIATIFSLRPR
ncbi:MAG: efflux RND transporter permease subunit [Rhodospirillales bacterium]|nr:efflux RND transporter permease subunit [Rhodospirillales bacterium]